MGKLIVFEGISGSGKSYLINQVKTAVHNVEETKWFDNKYVGDLLYDVDKSIKMTRDFFSLCYAVDFLGKYTYYIAPLIKEKNVLMHRYIYTALTHDYVRGTSKKLLHEWYNESKIRFPDKIVFLNTPPEVALDRICKYRKPSFYECGMDILFFDDISAAKEAYMNGQFSQKQLSNMFLEFQTQVYQQYIEMFRSMDNVVWIGHEETVEFYVNEITELIKEGE